MKGVRVDVHQSSSRSDNRKLLSITWSPSVAVVDEMAPRWITASSLRPFSQSDRSDGGMRSASWRLPRLRHLPSDPSISLTTTSVCPASFRSATTFDPMNPAPPVTSNISARSLQPPYFRLSRFPWRCRAPRLSRASVIVKPRLGHTAKPLMMKMSNIFSCLTVIDVRGAKLVAVSTWSWPSYPGDLDNRRAVPTLYDFIPIGIYCWRKSGSDVAQRHCGKTKYP